MRKQKYIDALNEADHLPTEIGATCDALHISHDPRLNAVTAILAAAREDKLLFDSELAEVIRHVYPPPAPVPMVPQSVQPLSALNDRTF